MEKSLTFLMKTNFLFAFLLFLNSHSFGQNYYVPNNGYLLNLTQKNDLHFSGYFHPSSNDKETLNFQLGYSPIKYFGLVGSRFQYNKSYPKSDIYQNTQISFWDFAVGCYFPFFEKSNSSNNNFKNNISVNSGLLFDIYVGHSSGEVSNFYDNIGRNQFKIRKNYLQLGFHVQYKFMGIHMTTQVGNISYDDGIIQGGTTIAVQSTIDILNRDNNFVLIENSFQLDVGVRYGKIVLATTRMNESRKLYRIGVINQVVTLGALIDIDEFFRRKKMKP